MYTLKTAPYLKTLRLRIFILLHKISSQTSLSQHLKIIPLPPLFMCRMLIAIGNNIPIPLLLQNLNAMAQDKTIKHELNKTQSWQHSDGWGISYLKKNKWITKKSTKPIFKDQTLSKYFHLKTNILLAHVRKTSGTPITHENTHPFHLKTPRHNLVFAHNGSINDNIEFSQSLFKPKGQTDTEQLLYAILSEEHHIKNITQTIQDQIHKLQNYSGTNIIFSTKNKTIIALAKNKYPHYFQMTLHKTKDYIVISSEPLKHLTNRSTSIIIQPLATQTMLIIDNNTQKINVLQL